MNEDTRTPSNDQTIDDNGSEWEYEYHETETEVGIDTLKGMLAFTNISRLST